jgi:crotonobetainyl-CoA:carnitine CoA-transferase CaiB-like acyl-CoA transferase
MGEHTEAVLRDILGLETEELAELAAEGVLS